MQSSTPSIAGWKSPGRANLTAVLLCVAGRSLPGPQHQELLNDWGDQIDDTLAREGSLTLVESQWWCYGDL